MRNEVRNRYDRRERKLYTSMGPDHIYLRLALLTFYTPYWRKICRMLSQMRRMDHVDFKGDCHVRMTKYARAAYRDTRLPPFVKWVLRNCILTEFKIEVDPSYGK